MGIDAKATKDAAARRMDGLGERVLRLRGDAGMLQRELADAAGIAVSNLSFIEAGHTRRIEYATLKALAGALRVKPHVVAGLPRIPIVDLRADDDGSYLLRAYASMCKDDRLALAEMAHKLVMTPLNRRVTCRTWHRRPRRGNGNPGRASHGRD